METLKDRIAAEGRILGNGILKIDSLINHQVDPMIMDASGQEFADSLPALTPPAFLPRRFPASPLR
jgi:adenine/guanine phosphoribosyltransferase-like PRPP-binding protein